MIHLLFNEELCNGQTSSHDGDLNGEADTAAIEAVEDALSNEQTLNLFSVVLEQTDAVLSTVGTFRLESENTRDDEGGERAASTEAVAAESATQQRWEETTEEQTQSAD